MSFVGHEGWLLGYVIGLVVVLVVVALVVPILLLAHRIGGQAQRVNGGLEQAVRARLVPVTHTLVVEAVR